VRFIGGTQTLWRAWWSTHTTSERAETEEALRSQQRGTFGPAEDTPIGVSLK